MLLEHIRTFFERSRGTYGSPTHFARPEGGGFCVRQAPGGTTDAAGSLAGRGRSALPRDDRLQARAAGSGQTAGAGFQRPGGETEVGQRHHVPVDGRGLAVSGGGAGPIQSPRRGLVYAGEAGSLPSS
jgi:hypothetical protein